MGDFVRRLRGASWLEDQLRGLGAKPRNDFVRQLSSHVRESHGRSTRRGRLIPALVAAALMVVPFVALGGVGYAASAAKTAVQAVVPAANPTNNSPANNGATPAANQYSNGKKCGQPGGGPKKPNQTPCPPEAGPKK